MLWRGKVHCFSFLGEQTTVDGHRTGLQDCYQLKDKFPLLYDSYMNGGFVVNTTKKGNGVPFDQALEQCYNRPAKVSGGDNRSHQEEGCSSSEGNIKHKKEQYVDLLKKNDIQEELSLHHDFNPSTTTTIIRMVRDIEQYLLEVYSPLQDQAELKNILTGEVVTNVKVDKLICCMREGHEAYTRFINDRPMQSHYRYTQPLAKSSLQPQTPPSI